MEEENKQRKERKWYDSDICLYPVLTISASILALALSYAISYTIRTCDEPTRNSIEMARIKAGYSVRDENVRGNKEKERFVDIGDERFYSKIDGKSLEEKSE